ncbi:MAG: pyrroline-5-carboxylate reductase [Sulfolobaceae archaeon]|nr:pyrroline-5-carboxylate reductase [Sulfolobaceae archaeon]
MQDINVISVLGAGKIGSAIIKAVKENCKDVEVIATGRREETLRNAEQLGAKATRDNDEAVKEGKLVILSVKPQHFPIVVKQVGKDRWKGKIVVSVMAGVKLKTLESVLEGAEVYRAMTNVNAMVKKASTAVATNNGKNKDAVENLLKLLGTVYWVPEEFIDVWTALIGSGPAFLAEIIDALTMGAVASGMPRELAYNAILDVMEGTAVLLKARNSHPISVRDEVTTPAGTTIRGLMVMEARGVKSALMETIEAAYKRSIEIGNEIDKEIRRALGLQ